MSIAWENDIAELLNELSGVQSEVLDLLAEKRRRLAAIDTAGLAELEPREQMVIAKLEACQERRAGLLAQAQQAGMPSGNLRALAGALPRAKGAALSSQIRQASARSRLLEHHSLTNWVVVQRTLIHLAQMLEIIATGGRPQPTYGSGTSHHASGSLVDQAA